MTDTTFSKSAEPQDSRNEQINYIAEIRRMMYGFGDCPEPLTESAKLIEDVVHRQMRSIIHKACEVADRRDSKIVTDEDFIFLLRGNKMKLRRLLKYLEIKEFKASIQKALDTEPLNDSLDDTMDNSSKKKCSYYKIVNVIDNTGELLANKCAIDHVKHNRNLRAEMIARKIDEARYVDYSRARCISFANRNQHKFSDWISCEGDMRVSKQGYVVLGYLAYETVAEIIDLALLIRQDQNKIHGDSIDRLKLSYHNPYTYKPYAHSKSAVTKPISPAEISEALRRYWSPQLDITGPFHRWFMHRPHLKLLSC